ncbi:MAG TPA: PqqD family protein [Capsulimonadaceae bacterium]|nr:PqqD family protein [Capsulimonadaceae bacterium]
MLDKIRQFMPFLPGGKPQPTQKQVMSLRPLRNPAVKWERAGEDNLVVISYTPKTFEGRPRFIDRLFGISSEKKIELTDELSSSVWEMCDGKHSVSQIAVFLAEKYKLGRRQSEVSVLAFLKTLQTKRLVGVPLDQAKALASEAKTSKERGKAVQPKGSEGFYARRKVLRQSKDARRRTG